jgi:anti-anti-sigma regulatory factor
MRIQQSTRDGCAIVALAGHLDLKAAPRVRHALLKRVGEQPVAVICDLAELTGLDLACATIFGAIAHHPASGWPATSLLLCNARPAVTEVLGRLRLPAYLPVFPTLEAALAHATANPPYLREELVLASTSTAPRTARRFVREICRAWRLDVAGDGEERRTPWPEELVDQAVLVADELVTNAVRYADGEQLRLNVEMLSGRLRLAVHDANPRLLRLAMPLDPQAEGGRGLLLVEQLTANWGVQHPPQGGKVVWCLLHGPN